MARPRKGVTFYDRVESQTIIDEKTGCWIFTGCTDECGYGRIWRDGELIRIHRSVFIERNGPLAQGIEVCHHCDTPACWNPAHLYGGTHAQNMADMINRGRRREPRGSARPFAKLDEARVREIKRRLRAGERCAALGREFGVSECAIGFIKRGRTWGHVV
jgi:hypothetical protein